MIVGGENSRTVQDHEVLRTEQHIGGAIRVRRAIDVPALDEDVARAKSEDRASDSDDVVEGDEVVHVQPAENRGLAQVRCHQFREREKGLAVGLDAALSHEDVAAGGHQYRIDHQVGEQSLASERRDALDDLGRCEHARLGGAYVKVAHNGSNLRFDDVGIDDLNCADAPRVLGRDRSERGRGEHTEGVQRADIGLNTGSATRVRARDGEGDDGLHAPTLTINAHRYAGFVGQLFSVGSVTSTSRLVVGTGGFRSFDVLEASLKASESTIATVALRRVDPNVEGSIYDLLTGLNVTLLPNTAGCYSAEEAIKVAELAREAFSTPLVKLEVIGDDLTLLPDTAETLVAAGELVRRGFEVWAYTSDDLIVAQRLEQLGCVAVMPLGSPIGSGLGIRNPHAISLITERVEVPILLDAGVGTASDAALAMELGCDGVLAASAMNRALEPVLMAEALRDAVRAGYAARRAGRIPTRLHAEASSPALGRPDLFAI